MFTAKQISALKYMIFMSKDDANNLMKRILVFLLDKSEGATKEVRMTFEEGKQGYTADEIHEAACSFRGLVSCNGNTHLDALTSLMGIELAFDVHYGHFDDTEGLNTEGQFGPNPGEIFFKHETDRAMPMRYTFWFAHRGYGSSAESIEATHEELEAIDLKRSGLYDSDD